MNDAKMIWNYMVDKLSTELTSTAIDTWIAPCEPVSFDGSHLILRISDEFKKRILTERFAPVITKHLQELLSGEDVGVILLSADEN